jgi:hypothetical protein
MSARRQLTMVAAALLALAPAARAAGAGASCAGPQTISALNQYCENIPGAAGGHTPYPGAAALAGQLHGRALHGMRSGTRRKLLALPAAVRLLPRPGSAATDALGMSMPLLLALLAVAIALGATAAHRRRHPRPV